MTFSVHSNLTLSLRIMPNGVSIEAGKIRLETLLSIHGQVTHHATIVQIEVGYLTFLSIMELDVGLYFVCRKIDVIFMAV